MRETTVSCILERERSKVTQLKKTGKTCGGLTEKREGKMGGLYIILYIHIYIGSSYSYYRESV